ncbi:MAG: pyruvate kinase, partial [Ignavibacteria bacterium]
MKNSKTKILATIGPATDSIENMEKLIECGVDAFRLNFSHGNKEYFERIFYNINEATNNSGAHIAILIDLQGPKIRVGELEDESVNLKTGKEIIITTDNIKGNSERIS